MTKEERIRREGMAFAYHLVNDKGIEALKERLTRNEMTDCPAFLPDKALRDFERSVKISYYRMVLAVALFAIESELEVTADKMDKICLKVADIIDSIYGGWLDSHKELEEYLQETYGINLMEYIDKTGNLCNTADEQMGKREVFTNGHKKINA